VESSFAQPTVFNKEVVEKWKAYEIISRNLQGAARGTGTLVSGKPRHFLYSYKQNKDCALLSKWESESPNSSFEIILFANSHYAANIKRNRTNPNEVMVRNYSDNKNAPLFGGNTSVYNRVFLESSLHFCCCLMPLTALLTKPEFTVRLTAKDIKDGRELVRMDYQYVHTESVKSRKVTRTGSIYFDPFRCWCVRQINETVESVVHDQVESKYTFDDRFETIQHSSGFPLLKRRTHNMKRRLFRNKDPKEETATTITDYEWEVNNHVPDSDFRLSAFGLPEPMGAPPLPRSHTWLWLLVAALAAAGLALLFAWLKRRRTLASRAKPQVAT